MVRTASNPYEEEISLAGYLAVLWRYRAALLIATLLGSLVAFVVTWFREPVFEATTRLMVSASKIGDDANQAVISIGTFINLVNNQTLVIETMNDLGLTKPPRTLLVTDVMPDRLRVEAIRDANVIEVRARFWEPQLAADFANQLAERSVKLAERLFQQETVAARDTIKVQVDQSKARLDEAERLLDEFKQKAQVDLLLKDTDALLRLRGSLASLRVDIEAEQGRVAVLTRELEGQERVRNVRRSVDATALTPSVNPPAVQPPPAMPSTDPQAPPPADDPPPQEAAPDDASYRLRGELLDPYVNPVHEMLQQQLATSRARLSGLERQRAEIMRIIGGEQAGVPKMSELYAKQSELSRLQTETELVKKVYQEVSTRYEQARLQVAGRSAQLQVIDLAVPPESRVSQDLIRNTVLAGALSLLIASVGALLFAAVAGEIAMSQSGR